MSHAYPLGKTIDAALARVAPAARTRAEAEKLAGKLKVVALTTDWLTVSEAAAEAMFAPSDALAHGHLQRYEDEKGHPVIAVTWWKLEDAGAAPEKADTPKPEPAKPATDHTDDLYFRRGRTKPSRRRYVDPRQLDLFRKTPEN